MHFKASRTAVQAVIVVYRKKLLRYIQKPKMRRLRRLQTNVFAVRITDTDNAMSQQKGVRAYA